ncbi:hypothetical protein [Ruminococcus albus]|uniref:Uncharacterized protein n=1 Tax=Ruminococcus albus TaxID=1264 RepID=A0A1I1KBC2_RUMAL|nr:hypothetical protein [Ruminococcus albus]SFC58177.1 hypothetical protein SAMN02910406_01991 [Ruminococcus albus]
MENIVDVDVPGLGILSGRDCIHIDIVIQDNSENLEFKGEINGSLAEKINEERWIAFTLTFHRVFAFSSCDLDTYLNMDTPVNAINSDLNILENSKWLENLPIRADYDRSALKHYLLFTYDNVYNIIADSFDINL